MDHSYGVFRSRAQAVYVEFDPRSRGRCRPRLLIANQDELGSGYVIRDCSIHNTYARGIIAKASNGLIEGCTIEHTARAAIESIRRRGSGARPIMPIRWWCATIRSATCR